ncbi:hypothetical protein LZL87_012832 [Fusarium oxysporum]|nr:hypothetical protein LZL87_012832 [Fusarium oxysporum]
MPSNNPRLIRVGIIGCGEITQVSHIATLGDLSDLFQITYLCDVSLKALQHCKAKVPCPEPLITTDAAELCASDNVDAVLIANHTAFHTRHAILALQHEKHALVEKPLALCLRDINALEAAEKASKTGASVMVGYMRRYAPALELALAEFGDKSLIQHVRIRDIIGDNAFFVQQSGKFPRRFDDVSAADSQALKAVDNDMHSQALINEFGLPLNDETRKMLNLLGGLGSHDLSLMREFIGMPRAVCAANLQWPIWTALLDYGNFSVVYESGINDVPVFDAHIELYTPTKIVRVNYDTPYIKALPITVSVREKTLGLNGEASLQERTIRTTYEDSYLCELRAWHGYITSGTKPKTSIADARHDVELFRLLMQAAFLKNDSQ